MDVRKYVRKLYFECWPGYIVNRRNIFYISKHLCLALLIYKKFPHYPPIAPQIAIKHNAESAIIVTCEITINIISHVRLLFLSVAESSIKHHTLYNNNINNI